MRGVSILVMGVRILLMGVWVLVVGVSILVVGVWILLIGVSILVVGVSSRLMGVWHPLAGVADQGVGALVAVMRPGHLLTGVWVCSEKCTKASFKRLLSKISPPLSGVLAFSLKDYIRGSECIIQELFFGHCPVAWKPTGKEMVELGRLRS